MSNLMPIGRFSRVTRLSIKALRHYDETGLLAPAWVDPSSGYRYYTYAQVTSAEVIRVLRSLDMPLDEIREVMAAGDREVVGALLDRHRARLQGEVDRRTRMLTFLLRLIDQEGSPMPYDVTVKEVPAQHAAMLRQRTGAATISQDVSRGYAAIAAAVGQAGIAIAGPPYLVMTELVDDEMPGAIELGFPIVAPLPAAAGQGAVVGVELPGGLVASTVHHGPYDEEGPAYRAVEAWVQEHGHVPAGPPREVYLTSPAEVADPSQYVTEIQFPIVVPA
jgi:DNA-binding transcriptional MerR regulator